MNLINPEFGKMVKSDLPKFVRKRTGELADFDLSKIAVAIGKASKAHDLPVAMTTVMNEIEIRILNKEFANNTPTIEQLQDIVEETLMVDYPELAREYIRYRTERAAARGANSTFMRGIVDGYIAKTDWRVHENSNMSVSIQGLHNLISSEVSKHYALENWYTEEIADAHRSGSLHIHDLGMLAPYCVGWDTADILVRGFGGVPGKLIATPPGHFDTACMQLTNFLFTTQGETSGAQALSSVDTYLAPFIRFDKLTYNEVLRTMRMFIFNLNVPTRVGLTGLQAN